MMSVITLLVIFAVGFIVVENNSILVKNQKELDQKLDQIIKLLKENDDKN